MFCRLDFKCVFGWTTLQVSHWYRGYPQKTSERKGGRGSFENCRSSGIGGEVLLSSQDVWMARVFFEGKTLIKITFFLFKHIKPLHLCNTAIYIYIYIYIIFVYIYNIYIYIYNIYIFSIYIIYICYINIYIYIYIYARCFYIYLYINNELVWNATQSMQNFTEQ